MHLNKAMCLSFISVVDSFTSARDQYQSTDEIIRRVK